MVNVKEAVSTEIERNLRGVQQVLGLARWWWLIRARYYFIAVGFLSALLYIPVLLIPEGNIFSAISNMIAAAGILITFGVFLISLLAPVGVYMERKNLPKNGEWYPSRWYYLIIFPDGLLALVLAYVYGKRRLKHYGNDSYAAISD